MLDWCLESYQGNYFSYWVFVTLNLVINSCYLPGEGLLDTSLESSKKPNFSTVQLRVASSISLQPLRGAFWGTAWYFGSTQVLAEHGLAHTTAPITPEDHFLHLLPNDCGFALCKLAPNHYLQEDSFVSYGHLQRQR